MVPYLWFSEQYVNENIKLFGVYAPRKHLSGYTTAMKVFLMHMTWDYAQRKGWDLDSYREKIEKDRSVECYYSPKYSKDYRR